MATTPPGHAGGKPAPSPDLWNQPPPATTSTLNDEPAVASASNRVWWAWLVHLVTSARSRLTRATLLLVAAFLVFAGALWFFGELTDTVFAGPSVSADVTVLGFFRAHQSPVASAAAYVTSLMGSEVLFAMLLVLLVGLVWTHRYGAAVSLMLVTVGAQLLNNVLKDHFQRPRPAPVIGIIPAQAWSFPSGHAMVSAAFYLFLAYLCWQALRGAARIVVPALFIVLVGLIGISRMYLGVHYFTDVVAGYVAGAAWTEAVIVAGSLLPRAPWRYRRLHASPVPAAGAGTSGDAAPGGVAVRQSAAAPATGNRAA